MQMAGSKIDAHDVAEIAPHSYLGVSVAEYQQALFDEGVKLTCQRWRFQAGLSDQ